MSSSAIESQSMASNVRVDADTLTVELADGRVLSVPIAWYPRLVQGTTEERNRWRFVGGGKGIHWPDLDEDISIENVLAGKKSGESEASLQKWREQRSSRKARTTPTKQKKENTPTPGTKPVSKHQLTGMTGVYLVAAELTKRGLIASPTSRSAQGADLLVTDIDCQRSFAVQVKTNARTFNFWLLGAKAKDIASDALIYALVNLRKDHVEYFLVPSDFVASHVRVDEPTQTRKTTWYSIYRNVVERYRDRWDLFEAAECE